MKPVIGLAAAAVACLVATAALAEKYTVERSIEITSSPQEAWNYFGDFCDIDDWHPAVTSCKLKAVEGVLHRVLVLADGSEFDEKRIAEEAGSSYTYRIVSSPLPVEKYTATLSITRGSPSTITWSGRFTADDPDMEKTIAGIYEAGLAAIEAHLSK